MSNDDPEELRKETGQILGAAVAEVASVVLKKDIGPFQDSLAKARQHLEDKVEEISEAQEQGGESVSRLELAAKKLSAEIEQQRCALEYEAKRLDQLSNELKTAGQELSQQGLGIVDAIEEASKNVADVTNWLESWREEQLPNFEKRLSDHLQLLSGISAKQEDLAGLLSKQAHLFFDSRVKLDAFLEEINDLMLQQRMLLDTSLDAKTAQLKQLVTEDQQGRARDLDEHRQLTQTLRQDAATWRSSIKVVLIVGIVAAVLALGGAGTALFIVMK